MTMTKNSTLRKTVLSLIGFVFLWAVVTDAWEYSEHFCFRYGTYVYGTLSRVIWVLPAVYLILRHSDSLRFSKKDLFSRPVWNWPLAIVLTGSLLFVLVSMLVNHHGFWINPDVVIPLEIIKYALVGFVEETVFRGWGYNALSKAAPDGKAILLSTAFFVLLHWPAYLIKLYRFGTFDLSGMLAQSLSAAIWGVLCCWLLKKGETLWNPVIAHFFYDALFVLFVG